MDSPHGNAPYYPPPPKTKPDARPPPPLPPRYPSDPNGQSSSQRPPLPPRPASGSLRNWGTSLARNVSSNVKTLAREGAQAAAKSSYFKQVTSTYSTHPNQQPLQQQNQQPQYQYPQSPPIPQPYQPVTAYQPSGTSDAGQQTYAAPQLSLSSPGGPLREKVGDQGHSGSVPWHGYPQQQPVPLQSSSPSPHAASSQPGHPQQPNPAEAHGHELASPWQPQDGRSGALVQPTNQAQTASRQKYYPPSVAEVSEETEGLSAQPQHSLNSSVSPAGGDLRTSSAPQTNYQSSESTFDRPTATFEYESPQNQDVTHPGLEPTVSAGHTNSAPYRADTSHSQQQPSTNTIPLAKSTDAARVQHEKYQAQQQIEQPHSFISNQSFQPIQPHFAGKEVVTSLPPPPPRPPKLPAEQLNKDAERPYQAPPVIEPSRSEPTVSGQLGGIVSSLNTLNITNTRPPETQQPQRDRTWTEDHWVRPPLSFNPDGTPNEIVWDCPGSLADVRYKTSWYHLPEVPDFLICTRCHDRFIARTTVSTAFSKVEKVNGRCRFDVPRITRSLLPQCQTTGSVVLLVDYFRRRISMQDCRGVNGIVGKENPTWFIIKRETNDIMINYVSCQACYEDILLADPSYGNEFIPRVDRYSDRPQGDNDTWVCDTSFGFVWRCLEVYSRNGVPFMDWVNKVTQRFQLPKCEGKAVESSSCQWVRPKDRVDGLIICEECYFDKIAWTAIEADFEYMTVARPVSNSERMDYILGHRSEPATEWVCDAKNDAVLSALESSIKRQDARIFCQAARTILSSPACTEQGIPNGKWYTLSGGAEEFDVCAAHFAGYFQAWGQDRFFEVAPSSGSETAYLCNLHPSAPRYSRFMLKLFEAGQEGVWSRYADNVRKYASIPECPRDNHVPSRRWYGWLDCPICPDCFEAITTGEGEAGNPKSGAGDGLVQTMQLHNEVIEDMRMCCMYSPRMRQMYAEARSRGNDPTELLEFSRQRYAVYARTVPRIKMLRGMQDMQMQTAMAAGYASVLYSGAGSIQSLSGSNDRYLHGNSQLGWYENANKATAAKLFNDSCSGFSAATSSSSWMEIIQLATEWSLIE